VSGLFRSELLRLTSRRLLRVSVLVFLGILLLSQVVAAAQSRPLTEAERAAVAVAQVEARDAAERCEASRPPELSPAEYSCKTEVDMPRALYSAHEVLPELAKAMATMTALLAFIIGASYVGADWQTGAMQALLFWEPRRGRVVLAKAAALAVVLVVVAAVVEALCWGSTLLVAATRGTTEGVTGGLLASTFLTTLRGTGVVLFAGLAGFAIAGLARVTAAALGAALGYLLLVELILRGLKPRLADYFVLPNSSAVVNNGAEGALGTIGGGRGAVTLALYLVLLVGAFYAAFSQRDVS
jgi:hypothetical protein